MANELQYIGEADTQSGLTVTATVTNPITGAVTSAIDCQESGTTAIYIGDMPTLAAGDYVVRFYDGATLLGQGDIIWDGSKEIDNHLLGKLDIGAPDAPVTVVPGPPSSANLCRLYGRVQHPHSNAPAANVVLVFRLYNANGAIKSIQMIAGDTVEAVTDGDGLLTFDGNAWLDVERTDLLTPSGSYWTVTCEDIGLMRKTFTTAINLLDLADIIT